MRAGELAFWRFEVVVFQRDPRAGHILVQMLQFFDPGQDMILNGFGQGDIVRR